MIFQKIHPLGSHRKIRKSGFGTPNESYEKLKPPGGGFAYKTNRKQRFCISQALGTTQGVCIRRGV